MLLLDFHPKTLSIWLIFMWCFIFPVILNGLPWKQTEMIVSFLRLHPSTAFWTLVDYDGYSISSKGFLPTVVDIMVIWVTIPFHFSSLIPKMLMFTLAISCLTTFNFPDSWTWHSRFLCNIALYGIGPCFYHQSHPQLGVIFALAPSLHSFWSYFSTDLQ